MDDSFLYINLCCNLWHSSCDHCTVYINKLDAAAKFLRSMLHGVADSQLIDSWNLTIWRHHNLVWPSFRLCSQATLQTSDSVTDYRGTFSCYKKQQQQMSNKHPLTLSLVCWHLATMSDKQHRVHKDWWIMNQSSEVKIKLTTWLRELDPAVALLPWALGPLGWQV